MFDPLAIQDKASYEDPTAAAAGIHAVIVNGRIALQPGEPVDMHAGQRLISSHAA